MTKRIYRGILLSSVITMLACLIFTIGIQYQMYDESTKDSLKDKAYIISLNSESGDLSEYADAKERITLITSSGKVLFDNKAIADKMENHLSRKEVKEALDSGEGYDVRRSETLGSKSCYYALKLKNGNILRISDDSLTVWTVLINLLPAICAIAIMTLVLSSVLAAVISKKILKPLNSIDLENPDAQNVYDELIPFINKINMQNRKIDRQIARLTRSRREFDIITENMSEGLVLTDIKGNILTHNKGIEKFFGVGEDINGKNILTLNRSDRQPRIRRGRNALRRGNIGS